MGVRGNAGHARYASVVVCLALAFAGCSADESNGGSGSRGAGSGAGNFGNPGAGNGGSSGGAASGLGGSSGGFGNQPVNPTAGTASGGGGTAGEPEACATAMVQSSRSDALIEFVIDGSGSMCENFGGSTRWQALRTALLDPTNGLIYRLQQIVHFGSVLYDGSIDLLFVANAGGASPPCAANYVQAKAMTECPLLVDTAPGLNNAAAIDMNYPMTELGGSTPTDLALTWTIDRLIEQQVTQPDQEQIPQYIILATDGAPNDICYGTPTAYTPDIVAMNVLAQADRAAQNNIKIFVISLAGNDPNLQAHLDEVARRGDPGNPNAVTYTPDSPEELTNTLAALVGGAVGCEIFLDGMVTPGRECSGFVESLGNRLPCCTQSGSGWVCDDQPMAEPNGWVLKDPSTIELKGATCTDFLSSPDVMLRAGFPCDVFTPD